MAATDPDSMRAASRESWETTAHGWGRHAERVRQWGMAVSVAMIDGLELQPGQRVLELAAGPGDTGFMAAELIRPGGTLLCTDGAEAMLEIARERARTAGIDNVEFLQIELEWIDLPTASVDAILCRWGIMLTVDPEAAAREARRVLRAGARAAFAVWDKPQENPWASVASRALLELGLASPPDPTAPGPFALSADGRVAELLEEAGFTDVTVSAVAADRHYDRVEDYIAESAEVSPSFSSTFAKLDEATRGRVREAIAAGAQPFTGEDGTVVLPGRTLVAIASA